MTSHDAHPGHERPRAVAMEHVKRHLTRQCHRTTHGRSMGRPQACRHRPRFDEIVRPISGRMDRGHTGTTTLVIARCAHRAGPCLPPTDSGTLTGHCWDCPAMSVPITPPLDRWQSCVGSVGPSTQLVRRPASRTIIRNSRPHDVTAHAVPAKHLMHHGPATDKRLGTPALAPACAWAWTPLPPRIETPWTC
jgi:hypothetical protein